MQRRNVSRNHNTRTSMYGISLGITYFCSARFHFYALVELIKKNRLEKQNRLDHWLFSSSVWWNALIKIVALGLSTDVNDDADACSCFLYMCVSTETHASSSEVICKLKPISHWTHFEEHTLYKNYYLFLCIWHLYAQQTAASGSGNGNSSGT